MGGRHSRTLVTLTILICSASLLVLALATMKGIYASSDVVDSTPLLAPSARAKVEAAWHRAREADAYDFRADVVQRTVPVAKAINAGRGSKETAFYLEGQSNAKDDSLQFAIRNLADEQSAIGSEVEARIQDGRAYLKQNGREWEEVDDFSAMIAPEGDFLGYLVALKDVAFLGEEARAGISFGRYSMEVDGPLFAAHMRDQLQRQLNSKGELPPGITLDYARQYVEMVGSGELWIDEEGLPLRHILHLRFPNGDRDYLEAEVDVTFSGFVPPPKSRRLVAWEVVETAESTLSQMLPILIPFGFVLLLIAHSRSRRLYCVLAVLIIVSMVFTPILKSARASDFSDKHAVATGANTGREQTAQIQELQWQDFLSDSREAVMNYLAVRNAPEANNTVGPAGPGGTSKSLNELALVLASPVTEPAAGAVADPEGDDDGDGLTNGREVEADTNPLDSDSDDDGLTDYEEVQLGTDPNYYDSDSDQITDTLEVHGFDYPTRTWQSDPLSYDTNQDGLSDGDEWFANQVGDLPGDTDGDTVPDLFDDDNDGDGVPDAADLSPFQKSPTAFDFAHPFHLQIDNLTEEAPVYVEFQLRPQNPDRLWYAFNVLDWPMGDEQGQVQDGNGETFSGDYPAENGDLRFIPMLEIRISGENHQLPSLAELDEYYGIHVQDLTADGTQVAAYVPLQLTLDENGENKVAFHGKMAYLPAGAWDAQEVRLAWVVQALVDVCDKYDDQSNCTSWSDQDQLQVIQVYYDDWYLTGLRIVENHDYQVGIFWEDAAQDYDLNDDLPLTRLATGMMETFLNGRVDEQGERDITVDELQRRFDPASTGVTLEEKWGITETFRVYTKSFAHADLALANLSMTTTLSLLTSNFSSLVQAGGKVTPTMLFASEEKLRTGDLDYAGASTSMGWNEPDGRLLTVDMTKLPEGSTQTTTSLRWQPYCYRNDSWVMCPIEEYWDELERRYQDLFASETNPDAAGLLRTFLQSYYLVFFIGQSGIVSIDELSIPPDLPDEFLDAQLKARLDQIAKGGYETISARVASTMLAEGFDDSGFTDMIVSGLKSDKSPGKSVSKFRALSAKKKGIAAVDLLATALGIVSFAVNEKAIAATEHVLSTAALIFDDLVDAWKEAKISFRAWRFSRLGGATSELSKIKKAWALSRRVTNVADDVVKAATLGLVVELVLIWGMFFVSLGTSWSDMSSIDKQVMASQAIAATIIVLLFFVLALIATGVGAIVVVVLEILLGIVELILLILGLEEYSPTAQIAKFLYTISPIADPDVKMQDTDIRPKDNVAPTVGDSMLFTTTLRLSATETEDRDWKAELWGWLWSTSNLRSTAVVANIAQQAQDLSAAHGTMTWDRTYFNYPEPDVVEKLQTESEEVQLVRVGSGINVNMPLYLNVAYDIPVASCWFALLWTVCTKDYVDDHFSDNVGQSITLDVFPVTLDQFYRLDWDPQFAVQRDHDGDGLLAKTLGGLDPDDFNGDSDGDGLADAFELRLREAGDRAQAPSLSSSDTDGDHLCDDQEILLGTSTNQRDSDGDGLDDNEEIAHQDRCDADHDGDTSEWVGGWTYEVSSTLGVGYTYTTIVSSDPLVADTDGDGLSDKAEKTMASNPRAWTTSPVALMASVDETDRTLLPGDSFSYTLTVANNLDNDPPFYVTGESYTGLSDELGGQVLTDSLTIAQAETASISHYVVVPDGTSGTAGTLAATLVYSFDGFMHDGDLETHWRFDRPVALDSETLPNHHEEYPPMTRIVAIPGAVDSNVPYAVASIERPVGPDSDAHINLRTASTNDLMKATDALLWDSAYPRRYLGGYAPGVACNDAGECLVTWERGRYGEYMLYDLRKLDAATDFECDGGFFLFVSEENGEFEFTVTGDLNGVRPGFTFPWTMKCWTSRTNRLNIETSELFHDEIRYLTVSQASKGFSILFKERDSGSCVDKWWRNDDECYYYHIGWPEDYFDPHHPSYYYRKDYWADIPGEADSWTDYRLIRPHADGIFASIMSLANQEFISEVDEFDVSADFQWLQFSDRYGQATAASDGNDFLVAWASSQGVHARSVYRDGNQGSSIVRVSGPTADRDLADPSLVWWESEDRYILVWEDNGLRVAHLDVDGAVLRTPAPLAAAVPNPQADMAANSQADEVLLVYTDGSRIYGVPMATQNGPGLQWTIAEVRDSETMFLSPAVAYEPFSGGWLVTWLARSGDQTHLHYVALDADGRPLREKHGLGPDALHTELIGEPLTLTRALEQDLACSNMYTDFSDCAVVGMQRPASGLSQFLQPITMDDISPNLGDISTSISTKVWIDGRGPDTTIALEPNSVYAFQGMVTLGGGAEDPGQMAAGVDYVEVSVDGGQTWQQAAGAESWGFNWSVPGTEGPVTLFARSVDKLDNIGPEHSVTITLDRSAPETLTLSRPAEGSFVQASRSDDGGVWQIELAGHANDLGSDIDLVQVALEPNGSGWQDAPHENGSWALEYPLVPTEESAADPSGQYTISLRAVDLAGNVAESLGSWHFQVDNTPPAAQITSPWLFTTVVSQTATVTGVISDPGEVASGVGSLEIALARAGQSLETWMPITLDAAAGSPSSTWSYTLPEPMEGLYQIGLRGADLAGNSRYDESLSRRLVEIDTQDPEAACVMVHTGAGSASQTALEAWAQDFNLTPDGFSFACPMDQLQPGFYPDPWYQEVFSETSRLYRLDVACTLNGHIDGPTLVATDSHGHAVQAGCSPQMQLTAEPGESPVSAILVPANGEILMTTETVELEIGAHAANGLSALNVSVNGQPLFDRSWTCPPDDLPTIDDIITGTWDLAGYTDGVHAITAQTTDCLGMVEDPPASSTAVLDTQSPFISVQPTTLSLEQLLSAGWVVLGGTATDDGGLTYVQVSFDDGTTWHDASFGDDAWRYSWFLGSLDARPDGVSYPVSVRAIDRAGREASISVAVTVDIRLPEAISLSMSHDAGSGPVSLVEGETVSTTNPSLIIDWSPSSDGSGQLTYLAGWSPSPDPDPDLLTTHVGAYQHAEEWSGDPVALYAHVIVRDAAGNERSATRGPVYVDPPFTPDYVTDLAYHAWMDESCTLIGADGQVARYADSAATLNDVQKLYASWDANNLRLTWTGADWDTDGDLFIYLDTAPGGSAVAHDPYATGPAIGMPAGLQADYMIMVEGGGVAGLYAWNVGSWALVHQLEDTAYRLAFGQPSVTDLLIDRSWLGDPASLSLIALASEEESLNLWAAIPGKNPLNSRRATNQIAHDYLGLPFDLTQVYTWQTLDMGVCPNQGQQAGADLRFRLSAEPVGVSAAFLADDLATLLTPGQPLDADGDGVTDVQLPLDPQSTLLGLGQAINYSLIYTNTGVAAAKDVVVSLTPHGLAGIQETTINLANIEPGDGDTLPIPAMVDVSPGTQSVEVEAQISDATHGAFEWQWVQHRVDSQPPSDVSVEMPELYVRPGPNMVSGLAYDPAGVATIEVQVTPSDLLLCDGPAAGESLWSCAWNAPDVEGEYEIRARATDSFGLSSSWTPSKTLILDASPPMVQLSPATSAALDDGIVTTAELSMSGQLLDDYEAALVEVCVAELTNMQPSCEQVEAVPGVTSTVGTWQVELPIKANSDGSDHIITFRGFDEAGNSAAQPLSRTVSVDVAGPNIQVTERVTQVAQGYPRKLLAGTVNDGSGVESLRLQLASPIGNIQSIPLLPVEGSSRSYDAVWDGSWSYYAHLDILGSYWLTLEAMDAVGNVSRTEPSAIRVQDLGRIADVSIALATQPEIAVSGDPLTLTTHIENDGPGLAPGIEVSLTLPAPVSTLRVPDECVAAGVSLVCQMGDLLPTESAEFSIQLAVPFELTRTLSFAAEVSSEMIDLEPTNNRTALFTSVVQPITGLTAFSDSPTILGRTTSLSATVQTGSPVLYSWDYGDGNTGQGPIVSHVYTLTEVDPAATYPVLGTYTATVTASNIANQMTRTTLIKLVNSEPVVDTDRLDLIAFEDELIWIGPIYFSDGNSDDQHTATFDWGDGTSSSPDEIRQYPNGGSLVASHVYAKPGHYTVKVTVTDAYGGSGQGSFTITALNGFARYCVYGGRHGRGVQVDAHATLDCGWNPSIGVAHTSASGVGSRGTIYIRDGSLISGTLVSERGRVVIGQQASLFGGLFEREFDHLTIGKIDAYGSVILEEQAWVSENIVSRSDVRLLPRSFVGGHVTATGRVEMAASAIVSGTVSQGATVAPIPLSSPAYFYFTAGKESVTVRPGTTLELPPGRYGVLQVREGATLRLESGRYTFEWIQAKKNTRIEFDLQDGWINVDVVKNIELLEGVTMAIISEEGLASDIFFRVMGQVVNLHKSGHYLGTFLVPNGSVQLGVGAELTGALFGWKVDIGERTHVTGMPARVPFAHVQVNPDPDPGYFWIKTGAPGMARLFIPLLAHDTRESAVQPMATDGARKNSSYLERLPSEAVEILQSAKSEPTGSVPILPLSVTLLLGLYLFWIPEKLSSMEKLSVRRRLQKASRWLKDHAFG